MAGIARGAELAIAVVLAVAGLAKLTNPKGTRLMLSRVLDVRRLTRATATGAVAVVTGSDLVVAASIILFPGTVVAIATTSLTVAFLFVVLRAQRRGVQCGCFGTLMKGTTGFAEVRRSVALIAMASIGLTARMVNGTGRQAPWVSLLWATAWLGLLVAVSRRSTSSSPESIRLALTGATAQPNGWSRPTPWARALILRTVAQHPDTRVVTTDGALGDPTWWRSKVRVRRTPNGKVASVVVDAPGGVVQALVRRHGRVAVIGFTPSGIVLPR